VTRRIVSPYIHKHYASDKFYKFCKRLNGDYRLNSASICILPEPIKSETIKDLINLIDAYKTDFLYGGVNVCLMHTRERTPDIEDEEFVCYYVGEDAIIMETKYHSDYGIDGFLKKDIPKSSKHRETVDSLYVVFKKDIDVDRDYMAEEWRGLGVVSTRFRLRTAKKHPDVVAKSFEKAREDAKLLASEALKYIEPE